MDRKIKGVGLAAGFAAAAMWLLGYFFPDLMETAPIGLEATITGGILTFAGWYTRSEKDKP